MAAASSILANKLHTNIFKPCYIPESPAAGDEIRKLLLKHCGADVEKEAICRSLLLSAYPTGDEDEAIKKLLLSTRKEVVRLLRPFVIGSWEGFQDELDAFFADAVGLWRPAQRSKVLVVASVDDADDWPWAEVREYDDETSPPEPVPLSQGFIVLNLFPRIFTPSDDAVLHPGHVLWSDQRTVVAAKKEFRRCEADRIQRDLSYLTGGTQGRHERRRSGYGSPPGSPVAVMSSFNERVQRQRNQELLNATQNGEQGGQGNN